MRTFFTILLFLISVLGNAAENLRPAFDKSAYRGTLWATVNPWFPPNKPRRGVPEAGTEYNSNPQGGPNYARKVYPDEPVACWKEAMRECQAKGMTGWQFELTVHAPGFAVQLKQAVEAAESLGNFKLVPFLGLYRGPCGPAEQAAELLITQFEWFEEEFKNSEAFYRLDGAPVLFIYTTYSYSPEEWAKIIDIFEKRFGKCIWLANYWDSPVVETKQEDLRKYMPVFDGCTAYANWGGQDELDQMISEVMHNEFPDKIYEAAVHNTYSVHYLHSGSMTKCARKYRDSWESVLRSKPDSVTMTNLFDHWENSLVLPCYEREDFLLRYAEAEMHRLCGKPFQARTEPEAVVTSYIDMVAGWRDLFFEVVTFPIDHADKDCHYQLELLDEAGQVVHAFPATDIRLDDLHTEEFSIPSTQFAGRLLIPRLRGFWRGEDQRPLLLPPVWVDPALRSNLMFWARSTANALHDKDGSHDWTLNGKHPGKVVAWREVRDPAVVTVSLAPVGQTPTLVRLMRNGEEILSLPYDQLAGTLQVELPEPAFNDDYYWLELECANGNRLNTLPIWVSAQPADASPVSTVLPDKTGQFQTILVKSGRVPVFYYPCDRDPGTKLRDVGGLQHFGNFLLETVGYRYGSLERTGNRHYVNEQGGDRPVPGLFQTDEDGRSFLRLADTKGFFMLMGGNVFPYSGSYEISVRPAVLGQRMGIFGTVNGAMELFLDEQGYVKVRRSSAPEGVAGAPAQEIRPFTISSRQPLKVGEWAKLAVTYDCHALSLYVDGELQNTVKCLPNPDHFALNYLTVGCSLQFLHNPFDFFNGDFREVRFTGRPLAPEELL